MGGNSRRRERRSTREQAQVQFDTVTIKQFVRPSKVKAIIVDKLVIDESEVTEDSNFMSDLGADSLDTVELIMEFEKEFDLQIPDDEAEKITTVGEAIKYIEERT